MKLKDVVQDWGGFEDLYQIPSLKLLLVNNISLEFMELKLQNKNRFIEGIWY